MCIVARIDNNSLNINFTQGVGRILEDSTNAYVFWMTRDPAYRVTNVWASVLKCRPINKTTLVQGTEQDVAFNDVVGGEQPNDWASVAVVRLDSGVMIAAFGTNYLGVGNCVDVVESAANDYTTWGVKANLDATVAGRAIGGMTTDGVNCLAYTQDQNTADIYAWKRTAANTWIACTTALTGGKIYDSSGYSATAPWYDVGAPTNTLSSMVNCHQQSATVAFLLAAGGVNSTSKQRVSCLWTTDGWLTTHETVLKDYSALSDTITNTTLQVHVGSDGRARALWFELNAAAGRYIPVLAYSDNYGQTWTLVGTPTAFSTTPATFDPDYDGAYCLDFENRGYLSLFDATDASNIKHYLYKGGDLVTGWTLIALCEHVELSITILNIAGATTGAMFVDDNGNLVRVFNGIKGVGPSFNTVNYLMEESVVEIPSGPPPLVEETLADAANVYLRLRLAEKRGWSVHDLSLAQLLHWPEGDFTTERQLDRLIGLPGSIDPSVSDPANLAALYVLDNEEHYGLEARGSDENDAVVDRLDEFDFVVETADIPLCPSFDVGLLRGFQLSYRAVAELKVEVLINGRVVQVQMLPPSGVDMVTGSPREDFIPVYPDENDGTHARLRISDRTLNPVIIEGLTIMRIEKGTRG